MLKDLMDQDKVNSAYLREFLTAGNHYHLLWIQEFDHGQYLQGSETLWNLAERERSSSQQAIALSLAKLAYLGVVDYAELKSEAVESGLKSFYLAEDIISLQTIVADYMKTQLEKSHVIDLDSSDQIASETMKVCFAHIPESRKVTKKRIKGLLMDLFNGNKVKAFGLLDLMTLINPANATFFNDCLGMMENQSGASTPFYRHLIWRRCWLSSSWKSLKDLLSDNEMIEALKMSALGQLVGWLYGRN